jgi:hypothetical protein
LLPVIVVFVSASVGAGALFCDPPSQMTPPSPGPAPPVDKPEPVMVELLMVTLL